jgi:L-rhamnose mutarotase
MTRIAFRLWLRPDAFGIETYIRDHLHPFPKLYDLIRAVGIRRYTIWLDGTDLFLTREGDDPWRDETLDMDDPFQRRWADTIRPLLEDRVAKAGDGLPEEVFALDPDAQPGLAQMTYRARLRPGAAAEMSNIHRATPLAVRETLRAAGVRRQWTWVEDGDAWTYTECDALDVMESTVAGSRTIRAWSELMLPLFDDQTRRDGPRRTREIFRCD